MSYNVFLAVPSSAPQTVDGVASDPITLRLYWSPPPLEDQNGEITHYGINITDIKQGLTHQYNTSGPVTSYIVKDLHPYYSYLYTLTAFTVVGHGPYSPPEIRQMPPAGIPFTLTLFSQYLKLLSLPFQLHPVHQSIFPLVKLVPVMPCCGGHHHQKLIGTAS